MSTACARGQTTEPDHVAFQEIDGTDLTVGLRGWWREFGRDSGERLGTVRLSVQERHPVLLDDLPERGPRRDALVEAAPDGERHEAAARPAVELEPQELRRGHELHHVDERWRPFRTSGSEGPADLPEERLLEERGVGDLVEEELHGA